MTTSEEEARKAWDATGMPPRGACPYCGATTGMEQMETQETPAGQRERFRARCSTRQCGARGPIMGSLTKALEAFAGSSAGAVSRKARLARAEQLADCGQDGAVCAAPAPGCTRHMVELNRELVSERDAALLSSRLLADFVRRCSGGGEIRSVNGMSSNALAIALAAHRVLWLVNGDGFVYVPGPLGDT